MNTLLREPFSLLDIAAKCVDDAGRSRDETLCDDMKEYVSDRRNRCGNKRCAAFCAHSDCSIYITMDNIQSFNRKLMSAVREAMDSLQRPNAAAVLESVKSMVVDAVGMINEIVETEKPDGCHSVRFCSGGCVYAFLCNHK
jgi:hypothetical protein